MNCDLFVGCSAQMGGDVSIANMMSLDACPESIRKDSMFSLFKDPMQQVPPRIKVPGNFTSLPICRACIGLQIPIQLCPLLKEDKHRSDYQHPCSFGKSCKFLLPEN